MTSDNGRLTPDVLLRQTEERLKKLIRPHLQSILPREDASDVAQSAYKSLFKRDLEGKTSQEIWSLLAQIALNKATSRRRWHTAKKRSVKREETTDADYEEGFAHSQEPIVDLIAQEMIAILPQDLQVIAALREKGYSYEEIADKLEWVGDIQQKRNKVQWKLRRIQQLWKEYGEQ